MTLSIETFCEALTLHREIDVDGTVRWYNADGKLHRVNGPAIEYTDGSKDWFLNDQRHREDGPAVEWSNGTKVWFLNGKHVDPF